MATSMRGAAAAGVAVSTAGVVLALAALALTLIDLASPGSYALAGLDPTWTLAAQTTVQTIGLLTLSAVAGLVVWRQPGNLFSRVLAGTLVLLAFGVFAAAYGIHGLLIAPSTLPLADVAAWTQLVVPGLVGMGAILVILLFPDGRLKSGRWGALVVAAALLVIGQTLAGFADPFPLSIGLFQSQVVPVSAPPALWPLGASFGWIWGPRLLALPAVSFLAGVAVILRMRSVRGEARQQIKWFAYAAAIYFLSTILREITFVGILDWLPGLSQPLQSFANSDVAAAIQGWAGLTSAFAGMVLVPIAIAIAILRYRLYDIDLVINRTILYVGLAAFVTLSYVVVVAGAGSVLGQRVGASPLLSVITIAALAALFLPVRSRLQALANVAVYGKRARPYDVLSDFAGSIGRAEPAGVLLPRMAELLRQGTGALSAEVWVKVGDRLDLAAAAPGGEGRDHSQAGEDELAARFAHGANIEPVFHDGELLGELIVVKPRGEELTGVERRLFKDLASQAGLVLVRFRLVQELRDSRSRIVAAQEVERRRIERDLHDGAQQRFVNALLALGMADIASENGRRELIDDVGREVRAGLAELRNLARGLHPPLLAEAGLVPAIQALADRSAIVTTVVAGSVRRYPDGVEAAAYFVIAEALANSAKHSGAGFIEVRVHEAGGGLRLEVCDDGVGGADPSRGSGIIGLHDRVAAAGGHIEVGSSPGGGTTIRAELPCA